MIEKSNNLLTIPPDAGQAIIEAGAVIARPLLGTDKFIQFCKNRGLSIDRERLIRLERMHLFAPIFRVKTPETDVAPFAIPPSTNNNWLEKGWAWDTTSVNPSYTVPDPKDRTQEGYYSVFQIDHLHIVLTSMTLSVQMDRFHKVTTHPITGLLPMPLIGIGMR